MPTKVISSERFIKEYFEYNWNNDKPDVIRLLDGYHILAEIRCKPTGLILQLRKAQALGLEVFHIQHQDPKVEILRWGIHEPGAAPHDPYYKVVMTSEVKLKQVGTLVGDWLAVGVGPLTMGYMTRMEESE